MSLPSDQGQLVVGEDVYNIEFGLGTTDFFVRVEHTVTTEVWSNTFSREYIETLTHKAGSFKELSVFYRMLTRAILEGNTDVVSATLYSGDDLKQFQKTKRVRDSTASSSETENMKYLVVTYWTEYDRVQYPLPLMYAGEPDPKALIQKIRRLQEMHQRTHLSQHQPPQQPLQQQQHPGSSHSDPRMHLHHPQQQQPQQQKQQPQHQHQQQHQQQGGRSMMDQRSQPESGLQPKQPQGSPRARQTQPGASISAADVQILTQTIVELREENRQLREHLSAMIKQAQRLEQQQQDQQRQQQQQQHHQQQRQHGVVSAEQANGQQSGRAENSATPSEINLLKHIVANLEQDVLEQKNKFHHVLQKKTTQIETLEQQLAAVQLSERNLRVKCRHLTAEMAARRGQPVNGSSSVSGLPTAAGTSTPRSRRAMRQESSAWQVASSTATNSRSKPSNSLTRNSRSGGHLNRGLSRSASRSPSTRRSTKPSPAPAAGKNTVRSRSASPARFDPTAYVKAREEKLRAARARRDRGATTSNSRGRSASPSAQVRRTSASPVPRHTERRLRARSKSAERLSSQRPAAPTHSTATKQTASSPQRRKQEDQDRSYFKTATEIEDIDARLAALTQYLQRGAMT
eukprot:m.155739 g.155739  ORF g.155739 m.155739 type:complete len:629 (-) comp16283_c2_seq5:120-2006(-)